MMSEARREANRQFKTHIRTSDNGAFLLAFSMNFRPAATRIEQLLQSFGPLLSSLPLYELAESLGNGQRNGEADEAANRGEKK